MPYLTNNDIETLGNLDLTPNGAALAELLIPAVEAAANAYTNRQWEISGNKVETFDGGQQMYFPSLVPVASVVSITVDGTVIDANRYFAYSSYIRFDELTDRGFQNVVITYTVNAPLPADVKIVLAKWVAQFITSMEDSANTASGGKSVKRAQFGRSEVEYFAPEKMTQDIPAFVTTVLDRYRLAPV